MTDNEPVAEIRVNGAVETREVCSVTLRTRGDDGNTISLTGGVDICVDDMFAAAVIDDYIRGVLEDE